MPTHGLGASDDDAWAWDAVAGAWRPSAAAGDAGGLVTGAADRSGASGRRADDFFAVERVGEADDRSEPSFPPVPDRSGAQDPTGQGWRDRPFPAPDPFDVSASHERPALPAYPFQPASPFQPPPPDPRPGWLPGGDDSATGTTTGGYGGGRWGLSVDGSDRAGAAQRDTGSPGAADGFAGYGGPAGQGQSPAGQGQSPAGQGQSPAGQGQGPAGQGPVGQSPAGQGAGHPWQSAPGPANGNGTGPDGYQPGVLRGFAPHYPDVRGSTDGYRTRPRDDGPASPPAGGAFSFGGQPDQRLFDTGAPGPDGRRPSGPQPLSGRASPAALPPPALPPAALPPAALPPAGMPPDGGFGGSTGSPPARGPAGYGAPASAGNGVPNPNGVGDRYGSDRPVNGYGLAGHQAGYPPLMGADRELPARQPDTTGPGDGSTSYLMGGSFRAAQPRDRGRVPPAGPNPPPPDRGGPLDAGPAATAGSPAPSGYGTGGYPGSGAARALVRGAGVNDDAPVTPGTSRPTAGRADGGNDRAVLLPPTYRGPAAATTAEPSVPARPHPRTAPRPPSAVPGARTPGGGLPGEAAFADPAAAASSAAGPMERTDIVPRVTDAARPRTSRDGMPSSPAVPPGVLGQSLAEMTATLSRIGSTPDTGSRDTGSRDAGSRGTGPDDDDGGWKPSSSVRKKVGRPGTAAARVSSPDGASTDTGARGPEQRSTASGAAKRPAVRLSSQPDSRRGGPDPGDDIDDVDDDVDDIDDDGSGGPGSGLLARYRHGWTGPLIVAVLVSLVAVGLYALLSGGAEDLPVGAPEDPVDPGVTAAASSAGGAPTPATSNPDAAAGRALVDGTYRCYRTADGDQPADGAASADNRNSQASAALPNKLVVPRESGSYRWDDQQGTYSITKNSLSTDTVIFTDVQFADGPLKDIKALFINRVGAGDAGKDGGFLTFKDGSNRWCAIN
ncbi:hypothetical protein [Protofrankia sp. BMG5.30]|uniref:hypothetical protein n=1 Tax=Protofrankia sp. BMG5.30 TaxID=1834514 RepID=UPI0009783399|nr:hypothetical protein [Protofrankia sp. BMG5.30]ONH36158.1 hypothetical protein BL254_08360 [Protofrankia sp. BMG5.30]